METTTVAIKSLKARAEEFRARAVDCLIPRYSDLMQKGAAHLEEQARALEARAAALPPIGSTQLRRVNETDV